VIIEELRETFFHGYTPVEGDVVVEIGAGVGTETFDLAEMVGQSGIVVAVEAHLQSYLQLTHDLPGNVQPLRVAVTAEPGKVWITDGSMPMRNHTVEEEDDGLQPVMGVTLDAITARLERIDFLKVNIEGAEVGALTGGPATLAKTSHAVISCHDFLGFPTKARTSQLLLEAGFTVSARTDAPDQCRADYLYACR
jgi:FkbM family methyltransferase